MNVVHLSNMPVAGSPYFLSEAMNKYLKVNSRCIQECNGYGDGRVFPHDLLYGDQGAIDYIKDADVVFVHNSVKPLVYQLLEGKRVVLLCHSEPSRVSSKVADMADDIAVVAQYQPRLYDDTEFALFPNIIDIYDKRFLPARKGEYLTVGFSPSNTNKWPEGYKWNNKGHEETLKVLQESGVRYALYTRQPFESVIKERAQCHIVIDELVTGSYHRVTLEAASHEQMVLNAVDKMTYRVICEITGCGTLPSFVTDLEGLRSVLGDLKSGARTGEWVESEGIRARTWMQNHWDPKTLLERFFVPLMTGKNVKKYKHKQLFAGLCKGPL